MFCTKCGARSVPGSGFCGQCGASLVTARPPLRFTYLGTGGGLMKEIFVSVLLTVLTAGVFFFWAKTRFRRYYTGNVRLGGERFEYVGTGLELFLGFLKALVLVALMGGVLVAAEEMLGQEVGAALGGVLMLVALVMVMPVIMVGSRRYRMSRTVFRGVRFTFRGTVGRCALVYYSGLLLTIVTLGLCLPLFHNRMTKFFVRNTWYGNVRFEYDGKGGPLFGTHLLCVVLVPLTLGFSYLWYLAEFERHAARHSSILGSRFESGVDGSGLFEVRFLNSLLVIFTLGLGWPWARTRLLRYHIDRLAVTGPLDLDRVKQMAADASAVQEGLGTLLDGQTGLAEDFL
jgi:uncharacterized membrane protein YjgN (DUF898 family)